MPARGLDVAHKGVVQDFDARFQQNAVRADLVVLRVVDHGDGVGVDELFLFRHGDVKLGVVDVQLAQRRQLIHVHRVAQVGGALQHFGGDAAGYEVARLHVRRAADADYVGVCDVAAGIAAFFHGQHVAAAARRGCGRRNAGGAQAAHQHVGRIGLPGFGTVL